MVVTPQNVTLTRKIITTFEAKCNDFLTLNQLQISDAKWNKFFNKKCNKAKCLPFYKIGKKSSFPLIAGFSHFVSHLVQRKERVCEFVSRPSPFSCMSCFQSQNCFPRSNSFPCRFRVLGGSNFFLSPQMNSQLDKWLFITFLFKICEALRDIVSKLSINQSFFFS